MFLQKIVLYLSTACMFCYMLGLFLMLAILQFSSPSLAKKFILRMGEKFTMTQNPRFNYEDWGLTFMSLAFIKTASYHMWLSLGEEAFVGGSAPDSPVVTMDREKTSISKYLKDGWAFKNNYDINQHQSLEDRLSAAQVLVQSEPLCPVVVDEMTDVTTIKYGALPERLYILQTGKVLYKGGKGPSGYNPAEVRSFLEKIK
ncbi:type I iodothyronine deiodinase isoform X2 [Pelmatolapia mariae]|uniref:type I iodothyronine deiodinase isoform X2 n=1 Tax=Pelmatolapia mariae TaxID=158779 RepID=UPI002FE591B6